MNIVTVMSEWWRSLPRDDRCFFVGWLTGVWAGSIIGLLLH